MRPTMREKSISRACYELYSSSFCLASYPDLVNSNQSRGLSACGDLLPWDNGRRQRVLESTQPVSDLHGLYTAADEMPRDRPWQRKKAIQLCHLHEHPAFEEIDRPNLLRGLVSLSMRLRGVAMSVSTRSHRDTQPRLVPFFYSHR
jgi:hypothetical protein